MAGCCEHGNEPSVFVNAANILISSGTLSLLIVGCPSECLVAVFNGPAGSKYTSCSRGQRFEDCIL